jgi:hypothetical protein
MGKLPMEKKRYSEAIWFDISFVLFIFALFLWSFKESRANSQIASIFLVLVGSAFLYCKRYKEVSYVERGLFWVSDNVPIGRFRSNHIFIGLFMIAMGFAFALLPASNRDMEREELLWRHLRGSLAFWISMIVVLLLNLMVGLYNYYRKHKTLGRNSKGRCC